MAGIVRGSGGKSGRQKLNALTELLSNEISFLPTPEQRKLKSALWQRLSEEPMLQGRDLTLEDIDLIVRDDRLPKWWQESGFKEWLRNRDEFRERIEYLVFLSMDTLETILVDRTTNANAKVSAAKLLMEVGRKMPPKVTVEKYMDEKISEMDKKQLEEYIRRNMKLVSGPESSESEPK